jgi:hypothetical protein
MQVSRYTIKSAAHCSSADCSPRSNRKKDDNKNRTLPKVELTSMHFQSCQFFPPANFVGYDCIGWDFREKEEQKG